MKRTIVIAVWLLMVALPALLMAKEKAAPVDMKGMNHIFLGWVDVSAIPTIKVMPPGRMRR